MRYRTLITSFLVAAASAFCPTTPAQAAGIQGAVVGTDGRALQGAEIRIERTDKTGAPITTQTNARGSYASSSLPNGIYKISVVEKGAVKSNVTIKTGGESARVDFDLKPSSKQIKHYVLVQGTGTHLAARWIETDENGTPIAGGLNSVTNNGEIVRDMLRHQTNQRP
jgi:hypothetical protein